MVRGVTACVVRDRDARVHDTVVGVDDDGGGCTQCWRQLKRKVIAEKRRRTNRENQPEKSPRD